jgi:hypothetical protein
VAQVKHQIDKSSRNSTSFYYSTTFEAASACASTPLWQTIGNTARLTDALYCKTGLLTAHPYPDVHDFFAIKIRDHLSDVRLSVVVPDQRKVCNRQRKLVNYALMLIQMCSFAALHRLTLGPQIV